MLLTVTFATKRPRSTSRMTYSVDNPSPDALSIVTNWFLGCSRAWGQKRECLVFSKLLCACNACCHAAKPTVRMQVQKEAAAADGSGAIAAVTIVVTIDEAATVAAVAAAVVVLV